MRAALVLTLLTGCQLVFRLNAEPVADAPVDQPAAQPVVRGGVSSLRVSGDTVRVPRPADTDDADFFVVTILGGSEGPQPDSRPTGFTKLTDAVDDCGNTNWHFSVFAGPVGSAEDFDFKFTAVDNFSAIGVAYKNVGAVTELDFQTLPNSGVSAQMLVFAPKPMAIPGSVVLVAAGANVPIPQPPTGVDRITEIDNITVYDLTIATDVVPPITVQIPTTVCLGVSEIELRP